MDHSREGFGATAIQVTSGLASSLSSQLTNPQRLVARFEPLATQGRDPRTQSDK